jgi:transcription elongation factor GreA
MDGSQIRVGSRVRIRDQDGDAEFYLVGSEDADIATQRVSAETPIGRALLGHRPGDDVSFRAPDGVIAVSVVSVSDGERP